MHLARLFVVRTAAVLFALLLVLQVLDLLGESDRILSVPGNGQAQLLTYVSLRLPLLVQRFLPFCVLLGTLITFMQLNGGSEVVAMKAAGLSPHQVLAPLIVASLLIALASFAFNDRIVARAAATLDRWQGVDYRPLPPPSDARTEVWVKNGDEIVHVAQVRGRGERTELSGIEVYNRAGGTLTQVTYAARGVREGDGWRLDGVRRFDVAQASVTQAPSQLALAGVAPDRFTIARVDSAGLPAVRLAAAIDELDAAGRPTASLRADLWHKFAGPLSTVLMPLLAAVAAFGLARSGQLFIRAVFGMALGFAYFVADNFAVSMGNLGAYPPLLAAWGPFVLFFLIGEAVLLRTEE